MMIFSCCLAIFAQEATPSPASTPVAPEAPLRIATDEVRLNVMARFRDGRFVPDLKPDDLLVVEEGTPQTITSMRRVPANILFLLDTGGNLNLIKSVALTRLAAEIVIESLPSEDGVAAIQYADKVETISAWTSDHAAAIEDLDKRVYTGRRDRFADGLNAAVDLFNSRPLENRHLVLISDGLDSLAEATERERALKNILAANITVHVISYTQLEAEAARKASRRVTLGKGDTKPRVPDYIFDDMMKSIPNEKVRAFLKTGNEAQRLVILNLDSKQISALRSKAAALRDSEVTLQSLADDTGGVFQAPEEVVTVFDLASEIARAIGSQYVLTYAPVKPVARGSGIEIRKIRVSTHCEGVEIRSRQKLMFLPSTPLDRP